MKKKNQAPGLSLKKKRITRLIHEEGRLLLGGAGPVSIQQSNCEQCTLTVSRPCQTRPLSQQCTVGSCETMYCTRNICL